MSELDDVAQQFRKELEAKRQKQREYIADGKCKDIEEYRSLVGQSAGLGKALEIFNTALRGGEQQDDEQQ